MISKIKISRLFIYLLLAFLALYFLVPLFVILNTSFKTLSDIRTGNLFSLPRELTIEAWVKSWFLTKDYLLNSILMVVPAVMISTIIGSLNGYILSKWRFKGSDLMFMMILLGCFIPFQTILLPMSIILGYFGVAGTLGGLIIVHVVYGIPFTTLFFRNYYVNIHSSIIQAARMDGAGFFYIFWRIIYPISAPIIVVTVIWQFTQIWNDFLFGVIYSSADSQPITVALNNIVNTSTSVKEYNVDMASAFIAGFPTLIVYVISGNYFIKGLTAGAVKG